MKHNILILSICLLLSSLCTGQGRQTSLAYSSKGKILIHPIQHASFIMEWNNKVIYADPAHNSELYSGFPLPDIILLTDIHGDHLDTSVLARLVRTNTIIVAPQAVIEKLPPQEKRQSIVLENGKKTRQSGIEIEAVPMYNLPQAADAYHIKGRGNGYILNLAGTRVYISGDTEDIPEMRGLKNIDIAFVCMNLPYTMDVAQAASAVLSFKPKIVYPYHHRGQDIKEFTKLVNDKNDKIEVRLLDWYPSKQ